MNKLMVELFEQAGISDSINEEFGIEYLAELIVRECANIADTAEPFKTSDLILQKFGIYDETLSANE